MRSFILIFLISSFAGCSSKENKIASPDLINSAMVVEDSVRIPIFKNASVSAYAKEYDKFIKDYLVASKRNNTSKVKQLNRQSIELIEKAKVVSMKLKTPAEVEKFQKWLDNQNKKIQLLDSLK